MKSNTAQPAPVASTLLTALWAVDADVAEDVVRDQLLQGALHLTGNFRGREAEVAAR